MLEQLPKPDQMFQGQPYWRVGDTDHSTLEGRVVSLEVWRSFCAECGEPFTLMTHGGKFSPSRRCNLHRKPGVRVARKRNG